MKPHPHPPRKLLHAMNNERVTKRSVRYLRRYIKWVKRNAAQLEWDGTSVRTIIIYCERRIARFCQ